MPVPDRRGFGPERMPSLGRMAYYPAFPPAVRPSGVGCIRVTHPSATLMPPKGHLPFDLHVLGLPLAFILSQDQTLRCSIVVLVFLLNLGFRFRSLVFLIPVSATLPQRQGGHHFVLASSFQRTIRFAHSSIRPLFFGRSGLQRYDLFIYWQSKISIIFDKILYYFDNQSNKIYIFIENKPKSNKKTACYLISGAWVSRKTVFWLV